MEVNADSMPQHLSPCMWLIEDFLTFIRGNPEEDVHDGHGFAFATEEVFSRKSRVWQNDLPIIFIINFTLSSFTYLGT